MADSYHGDEGGVHRVGVDRQGLKRKFVSRNDAKSQKGETDFLPRRISLRLIRPLADTKHVLSKAEGSTKVGVIIIQTFVSFVLFVVNAFSLTWLRLCRAGSFVVVRPPSALYEACNRFPSS